MSLQDKKNLEWFERNKERIEQCLIMLQKQSKKAIPQAVTDRIKRDGFIKLDIGCGDNKQDAKFLGMDFRKTPNVDIVHSAEEFPYPLPDECCNVILMSHVMEHLKPWLVIDIMNELWRVMKVGGQLWLAMPFAGSSGFWQDPTHIKSWNDATATYFDPRFFLYNIYKPKPWKLVQQNSQHVYNLNLIFEKLPINHEFVTPGGYDSHPKAENETKEGKKALEGAAK